MDGDATKRDPLASRGPATTRLSTIQSALPCWSNTSFSPLLRSKLCQVSSAVAAVCLTVAVELAVSFCSGSALIHWVGSLSRGLSPDSGVPFQELPDRAMLPRVSWELALAAACAAVMSP